MTRNNIRLLALCAALVGAYFFLTEWSEENVAHAPKPRSEVVAWPFSLRLVHDGKQLVSQQGQDEVLVSESDFSGKPWVLTFWATWCDVCRRNQPLMTELNKELQKNSIPLLGVASHDEFDRVVAYETELPHGYQIAFDPDGATADKYKVAALPHTFVIDQENRIIGKFSGVMHRVDFDQILKLVSPQKAGKLSSEESEKSKG